MSSNGRPILGVDIGHTDICIVEMRGTWPDYQLVRAGKIGTPPKSIDGGRVVDAPSIGAAIRAVLDDMGVSTRDAVLSVAESCVVTRVLDIPAVPANELRTVIEGELAHYQILGNTAGAFDFMILAKREGETEGGPQALVMAAEEQVVSGYRAAAELAGLNLIAMEPTLLACYRAGFAEVQNRAVAACLTIGRHESEITVVCNGQIRLYRRIDIGRDTLVLERPGTLNDPAPQSGNGGRVPFGDLTEEQTPDQYAANDQPRVISPSAASSITIELQRSLDYFASQSPDAPSIEQLVLTVMSPELAPLETWFSQAISINTVLARLPATLQRGISQDDPESVRYLCAAGLAMRELGGLPTSMPRFDLSSQQRNQAVLTGAKRLLTISLGAAAATLALGCLLALQLGMRANHTDADLSRLKTDLKAQQRIRDDYVASVQTRQDLLHALRTQGFPFPRIMDYVSSAIPEKTGLTAVSLDPGGRLVINGDANNEKEVIRVLENLRKVPFFDSVAMDTFDKQKPMQNSGWLVRFQISCQLTAARNGAIAMADPQERRQ